MQPCVPVQLISGGRIYLLDVVGFVGHVSGYLFPVGEC